MKVARFTATGAAPAAPDRHACDRRQNALTQVPTGINAC
jgi:hypothetical protein